MRTRLLFAIATTVVVATLAFAWRHELVHVAVERIGSLVSGYTIRYRDQRIGRDGAALDDLRVSRDGYPLLRVRRIAVAYRLRDLLPGSGHRFGLRAVRIDGAKITLVRFPDGSFNLALPNGAPAGPHLPSPANPVPIRLALNVRDAQVDLLEPKAYDPSAKRIRIRDVRVSAAIDSIGRTHYRATGAFISAKGRSEPFAINGVVDVTRGYAEHRARARRFPLRALANYFADTPSLRVLAGRARNFDARLYSLDVHAHRPIAYHANLQVDLAGTKLAFASLDAPIENLRGHLQLVDNAVFVRGLRGDLAGMPMRVTGGLFDLTGAVPPQLRIGIAGSGDLAQLRSAFRFTRDQPVRGRIALGILVEGALDNPQIVTHAVAPRAAYDAMPLRGLDATVVYRDGTVTLVPLAVRYGGLQIGVRGSFDVGGPQVRSRLAVHVAGPADRLPYLGEMLGTEPLVFDAAARGVDLNFRVNGALASARGTQRVAALIALDPHGKARLDPFWLNTPRGSLDAGYVLDRPRNDSVFWAGAYGLKLAVPPVAALPGITLPAIPPMSGAVDAFNVAGGSRGAKVLLAGAVDAGATQMAGVTFSALAASFAGSLDGASINRLRARGPWGRFDGSGAFSSAEFVARGRYAGTLDGLQPFLGSVMPGHGPIGGTVAIAVRGGETIVQGEHLKMPGATLRGIPVSAASLTLAIDARKLTVYSAQARAASGDVVAAGAFATVPHGRGVNPQLSLLADRLNAAQLHGIGLPIASGRLTASGNLAAGTTLPHFRGGVTIRNGRMAQYPLSGNAQIDMRGDAVALAHAIGAMGSTYALVDGRIGALTSGAPTYDLAAHVPAGNIASALRTLGYPTYMTRGSFNAELHVGGRGSSPTVAGTIGAPAGDVNGLPFVDATARLAAGTGGVSVHHGRVAIGTTALHFTAVTLAHEQIFHVRSPHADLSDFNNFFDTGDTLDGVGRIAFGMRRTGSAVATSGNIDVRGFRYRNLPFGAMRAIWSSRRNEVTGDIAVGGDEGELTASGTIGLVPGPDPSATLMRSQFDLRGSVRNLDLSLWVPALGFPTVPITGRVSGQARIDGRYPALGMRGSAQVAGGTLGPLTLDTATIAFHSVGTRIAIDRSDLETPGLSADASGSFGLLAHDPLDLHVHAQTDDLPRLVEQFGRLQVPVSGFFETSVDIGGTAAAPTFAAGFDARNVRAYGLGIDSMFGAVKLRGATLVLSDAGATFGKGEATLAGQLPLQLQPLRIGPAREPIGFDLDVVNLDPAIFDALLGAGTKMGGAINGHIGLSGTVDAPRVIGRATLENGSYVSDLERIPISHLAATLAFDRDSARVMGVSGAVGAGSLDGSGAVAFPQLAGSSGGLAFALQAHARGAQLDLPAYGSGTLDGSVSLTKAATDPRARLAGRVALSNATLPFAAFVQAAQAGSAAGGLPLPLAFDLTAVAGRNVRVRGSGYGAGLDIGATGSVHLAGTLAAPTLEGTFTSTGGTLTYFDRAFRVQEGSVRFTPSGGVIPTIRAVATTNVVNPDPDRARNPYGSAEVRIDVRGPIDGLKIGFSSNPPGYTQQQILGLIAPLGGFVGGIGYNPASTVQAQPVNGITPLGALSPLPNVYGQQSGTLTVGQEAFNILNAQFAAGLLSPLENALGQGLGLSSVNLTLGYFGNVGVSATRLLGKTVSAVYSTTFGVPQIQTFGVRYHPSEQTSALLNFFVQNGPTKLFASPTAYISGNQQALIGVPVTGYNGFSLLYQRYFW